MFQGHVFQVYVFQSYVFQVCVIRAWGFQARAGAGAGAAEELQKISAGQPSGPPKNP